MNHASILAAFLTSATCAGAMTVATDAAALFRRVGSTGCADAQSAPGTPTIYGDGVANFTTYYAEADCSFTEDSHFDRSSITSVTAHVYDATSSDEVKVSACQSDYNGQGGICGTAVGSGVTFKGAYALAVPFSTWTSANANDYLFLSVYLPAYDRTGYFQSVYKGMLVQ